MKRAFVFPGQGSQAVGMGRELADAFSAARLVFEEVDEALGQRLSRLMFEGPAEELTLTENAQPAIMAVSMAALRVLQQEAGFRLPDRAAFVAGHSLGEYAALAAAGSLTLADAARLLKRRGQAMQKAVPVGQGAMAAVLGLDLEAVEALVRESAGSDICACANDNGPGQVVISGDRAAVERAIQLAKEKHGKKAMMLPVSAPFHCPLMQPAADAMAEALAGIALLPPQVPVVSNVTATATSDPVTIKARLVTQVTGLVRWRETVLFLKAQGVGEQVELGAGRVLAGLLKRIDKDIQAQAAHTPAEIEALARALG
ncbi:MAG: ACP S-malonyltransferase [Alphaproteobacteria bacterium]|nr:ACP S-malonyltransferase [Alphaproteobacteria bacterium]